MSSVKQFADALQKLESDRDLDAFVQVFSPDVTLVRPESGSEESSQEGARKFWETYLAQFSEIKSTFSRLEESAPLGELEWQSEGTLKTGRSIRYRGVSLLELDDAGLVRRFATYYDTAAFQAKSGDTTAA